MPETERTGQPKAEGLREKKKQKRPSREHRANPADESTRNHGPKHGEDEEAARAHGKLKGAGSLAMGGSWRECRDCIVIRIKSRREER